jgi:hypothetical protein
MMGVLRLIVSRAISGHGSSTASILLPESGER